MWSFVCATVAFLLGLAAVPFAAWLIFIYPYSHISIKPVVWGFASGLICGALATFFLLWWGAQMWPRD